MPLSNLGRTKMDGQPTRVVALDGGRCVTRCGTMSGSSEWSLALSLVGLFQCSLHPCVLRDKRILTEVLEGIDGDRCRLAMERQMHGTSVRSRSRCGGPLAPIRHHTSAVRAPHPSRPIGRARRAVEGHGGERLGCELDGVGEKGPGQPAGLIL
jgi:hypothetical protein